MKINKEFLEKTLDALATMIDYADDGVVSRTDPLYKQFFDDLDNARDILEQGYKKLAQREKGLFDEFLETYVQNLIECACDEYDVKEDDINDIVCHLENNEAIWNIVDEAVFNELAPYEKEEE